MAIVAFECYTADAVVKFHCDFPFICWRVFDRRQGRVHFVLREEEDSK